MNRNIFTFIFIPIIVLTMMTIMKIVRNKLAKPNLKNNLQKPGIFDHFILKLITGLAILSGLLTGFGLFIQETEMTIVFSIMTLIFVGIALLLKREYNISYQENDTFFILNSKGKEYKVYYENIVDWEPSFNQIRILDETKQDGKYIDVNIAMLKPEKLLINILNMTFSGKFASSNDYSLDDSMRTNEIVDFLKNNNYAYLLDDNMKQ